MSFYKLKVWLTTITVSPLVYFWLSPANFQDFAHLMGAVILIVIINVLGFILSIPTLILFSLVKGYMKKRMQRPITIKLALSIVAIVGILVSSYIITGEIFDDCMKLFISYASIMIPSIWYFKLQEDHNDIADRTSN